VKQQTKQALDAWNAAELLKELSAKGQPPPIPQGWATAAQWAGMWNCSTVTANRRIARGLSLGIMQMCMHNCMLADGRVAPKPIYGRA
jgi:Fic family protein